MNHKVMNLQNLHDSSMRLYNNCIVGGAGSADSILFNLNSAVDNLKANWKGMDAAIAIRKVVVVYNAMLKIKKHLGNLSVASSKVAADYRKIQIHNGATLEEFSPVRFDDSGVSIVEDVDGNSDVIEIKPDVENAKRLIDTALDELDTFITNADNICKEITDNWQAGDGRDTAVDAFNTFMSNSNIYKNNLSDVSADITTALNNYK